jgi:chromosome segregation ATPase
MSSSGDAEGLRERLTRQGEESLGKLAQDLLENPLVHGALARAFEAREKAVQAQEVAMGALNIPSAADLERLTRRLRSVAQRLEGIEDGVDRLDARLGSLSGQSDTESRLGGIEATLASLTREVAALRDALPGAAQPVPREQERLAVDSAPAPKAAKASSGRRR